MKINKKRRVGRGGASGQRSDKGADVEATALKQSLESDLVGKKIRRATVPLYFSVARGPLKFNRSGVLLQIGDEFFILTAMHHLAGLLGNSGVRAFTQQGSGFDDPVELTGRKLIGFSEPADIGAVCITREDVRLMGQAREAITLKELDFDPKWDSTTPFVLSGFPEAWESKMESTRGVLSLPKPFTLITGGYCGVVEDKKTFSRFVHLSIHWPKQFHNLGRDTEPITESPDLSSTPKPFGMSGGGIWRVGRSPHDQTTFICRLSAIQHSVHRGYDYAVGTRLSMGIFALWHELPELRPAIEIALPATFPIIPSEFPRKPR